MLAGGTLRAQTEKLGRTIGQVGSDIPTRTPCLVCCVVKPLPTLLLSECRMNIEVSLARMAVEHEHHVGVASVSLVNVELLFGHGGYVHGRCAESPNDPKLSHREARHDACAAGSAGSRQHDVRSGSLQRMVRRCGDSELVIYEEVFRDGKWCQRHPITGEVSASLPLSELRQVIDETGKYVPVTAELRARIAREREARLAAGLVPVLAAESCNRL